MTTLFLLSEKLLVAAAGSPVGKALLLPATEVKMLKEEGRNMQFEVAGWRESKGRGRVIAQYMGKRVFSAVLDESLTVNIEVLQAQVDPDSHQEWQQMSVTTWTADQDFISAFAPIWEYSGQMPQPTCSARHSTLPIIRYAASGWVAGLKAVPTYYRLNPVEERALLKYLQARANGAPETNRK